MKNYKLFAMSINLNNRVYKTEDNFIFNETNTTATALQNAVAAGFLVEIVDANTTEKFEVKNSKKPKKS